MTSPAMLEYAKEVFVLERLVLLTRVKNCAKHLHKAFSQSMFH